MNHSNNAPGTDPIIKLAADIRPGDSVIESDGALLEVATAKRIGGAVILTFQRGMWICAPGPLRLNPWQNVEVLAAPVPDHDPTATPDDVNAWINSQHRQHG